MIITRPSKAINVVEDFDVAVVGGGFAGVAAALASARNGAKTCLIEKYATLGGLGTIGHVVIYLPLCDGRGRQVSFGLAEELLKLPMKYSDCKINGMWHSPHSATREELSKNRYQLIYDPAPMSLGMELLLLENNVTIIYDTLVTDIIKGSNGAISHLIVENKSGCNAISVKSVVDCSGDADICKYAEEECEIQADNHLAAWFYSVDGDRKLRLHCDSVHLYNDPNPEFPRYDGTDYKQVTEHIIKSRELVMNCVKKENAKRQANNESPIHPFAIPTMACFRMTRRVIAPYTITNDDMHKWHSETVGIFSDWRNSGPVYPLPYRSIIAAKTPNLSIAGRCLSATGDAWDVTRVIPVCSVSGEAAGTAAALQLKTNSSLKDLDVSLLQTQLVSQGMKLDPKLVEEIPPVQNI